MAQQEGIEDTVHTMKKYINDVFELSEDRILELSGYAFKLGEAKNNSQLVERAREFGRKMVEILTGK